MSQVYLDCHVPRECAFLTLNTVSLKNLVILPSAEDRKSPTNGQVHFVAEIYIQNILNLFYYMRHRYYKNAIDRRRYVSMRLQR